MAWGIGAAERRLTVRAPGAARAAGLRLYLRVRGKRAGVYMIVEAYRATRWRRTGLQNMGCASVRTKSYST